MNIRRPIKNSYSVRANPPRLFDVLVENGNVDLEVVSPKDKSRNRIPWDDVVYQVEAAKKAASIEK